jgi:hypothetical protein
VVALEVEGLVATMAVDDPVLLVVDEVTVDAAVDEVVVVDPALPLAPLIIDIVLLDSLVTHTSFLPESYAIAKGESPTPMVATTWLLDVLTIDTVLSSELPT